MAFLDAYVGQQKELGRFPKPLNNQLSDVMEFMDRLKSAGIETVALVMEEAPPMPEESGKK